MSAVCGGDSCFPAIQSPGDLGYALLQHPAVHDAVVLKRRDAQGLVRTIAYVVPADASLMETLSVDLRNRFSASRLPDAYVFLSAIPVNDRGEVALDRLEQIEVIEGDLQDRWKAALGKLADIQRVEVIPLPVEHAVESIHRLDLIPDIAFPRENRPIARSIAPDSARNDAIQTVRTATPACVDGASLIYPEAGPATLGESLRRAAAQGGNKGIAYVRADGSGHFHTYAQLLAEAERSVAGLSRLGIKPGDKVIFQLRDNHEFVVAFWGCVLGGMIPVPITIAPSYTSSNAIVQKLANAWRLLEQPLILASSDLVAELQSVLGPAGMEGARIQAVNELNGDVAATLPRVQPDDLALLLLTSGSTGTPKAVMHSHRTLLNRSAGTAAFNRFHDSDVSLNWMPLDHVGGIVMFHLRDVFTGCSQVQVATGWILEDPLRWMDLIERHKATVTWAPNFAYALVADKAEEIARRRWDLSSMRFILNGGEPIAARTARRFLRLLAPHALAGDCMHPAWGMSETASGITYSHAFALATTSDDLPAVEVGGPIPNTSLRIVDADNRVIGEGEKGNLQVRGASIMLGYYQNPEANRKVFTPDGWLDTGDVGVLHDGRLTVTARTKDEIIINGINYPAAEIEAVTDAVDGVVVSYSAACAVRRPDSDTDELAIFFSPASSADERLAATLQSIRNRVATDVGISPTYLIPLTTGQIPKTAIGKIQRPALKRLFESGAFDEILKRAETLSGTNTIPDWFFRRVWRRKESLPQRDAAGLGPSLVFVDRHGLGARVCEQLNQKGRRCITVEPGNAFAGLGPGRYSLDPGNPDHYRQLLAAIREAGHAIEQILHLWTYRESAEEIASVEMLREAQYLGLYSLLYLVQAMTPAEGDEEHPVQLHVFGSHTQTVSAGDRCTGEHATIIGMLKTIPLETPWLKCRHTDLEVDRPEANAPRVLRELGIVKSEDEVAYRGGRRFVWGLARVDLQSCEPAGAPLKQRGIYLITGGLGGIGASLARTLIRKYQAKLIMIGTTPLPDRSEWPAHAGTPGKIAERLRVYRELESLGGDVIYQPVDVSDLAALEKAVTAAESHWNARLAGIFHLASAADPSLHWKDMDRYRVSVQGVDVYEAMFRSKVYGTWAIHQLLKNRPEAIGVAFSSVISLFGGATFSAYAAAQSFLNSYSLRGRANGHPRSCCFVWSVWDEMGMSKGDPASVRAAYRNAGYFMLPEAQGIDSLIAALARGQTDLVIGLDRGKPNVQRLLDEALPRQKLAAYYTGKNGATGAASVPQDLTVPDLFDVPSVCEIRRLDAMPVTGAGEVDLQALQRMIADSRSAEQRREEQPRTDVEERIAGIWREVLRIQRLGIHDGFFQLGGNSLTATQVLSRVRQAFQVKLDIRDLFEHATIAELATLVQTRQIRQTTDADTGTNESLDPETLLADLAHMSDARVAELLQRLQAEEKQR